MCLGGLVWFYDLLYGFRGFFWFVRFGNLSVCFVLRFEG